MTGPMRRIDGLFVTWSDHHGLRFLSGMIGVVFLWFGALKWFPGLSPAEGLIAASMSWAIDPAVMMKILAVWECAIGVGLLTNQFVRPTIRLMGLHMLGTFVPLVTCPHLVWTAFPYALTLEGQYIVKNLVLVTGALLIFAQVHRKAEAAPGRRRVSA